MSKDSENSEDLNAELEVLKQEVGELEEQFKAAEVMFESKNMSDMPDPLDLQLMFQRLDECVQKLEFFRKRKCPK